MKESALKLISRYRIRAKEFNQKPDVPVSAIVQLLVISMEKRQGLTLKRIKEMLNGTTEFGAKNVAVNPTSILPSLSEMSCISRSERCVKPVVVTKDSDPEEEMCKNCQRNRNLCTGCIISDKSLRKIHFPELSEEETISST